ncbi:sensor histidine kinase [Microbacterium hominis]|uniref:sensor histidine kinase n=1 Tax=Microbacterium hominis TaxID=162426 RepID=UPI0007688EA3|nr:histidine kinase [Microbacterium hominis]KXC07264.1 hypothetical protein MhomT_01650 [Microbacterium hominis]
MVSAGSRGSPDPASSELRLPRPPGVIRRFWARHRRTADVLIALATAILTFSAPGRTEARDVGVLWESARPFAVVLLAVACVALLWRRRRPMVTFAFATAGAVLAVSSGAGVGGGAVGVAVFAFAVYTGVAGGWRAGAVAVGAALACAGVMVLSGVTDLVAALNGCAALIVSLLLGTLIGVNVGNRARYLAALMDTSRQLWAERERHARLAASAERTRIAREMHDVVSHSLTVVVALAEGASATSDAERGRAATAQIAVTARSALDEMRAMLGLLRDGDAEDDAPLVPLDGDTVRAAVEAARSAGLPVTVETSGPPIDDRHLRLAVARVVQEGLTNVMRHAPSATRVAVTISTDRGGVEVEVVNDGVVAGASPATGGYGIRGLHERAARVGGAAEAGPIGGGRWRVRLTVPQDAAVAR